MSCYLLNETDTARFPTTATVVPAKAPADPRFAMRLPWVSNESNLLFLRFAAEALLLLVLRSFCSCVLCVVAPRDQAPPWLSTLPLSPAL